MLVPAVALGILLTYWTRKFYLLSKASAVHETNQAFLSAARQKFLRRIMPIAFVFLLCVVAALKVIATPEFYRVDVSSGGILLNYSLAPDVFLRWEDVDAVRLHKRRRNHHWFIGIQDTRNREYYSSYAPTYREIEEMEAVAKRLASLVESHSGER